MTRSASLIDKAIRLRTESKDGFTYDELVTEDLTTDEVAALWLSLSEYKTAAAQVEKAVSEYLAILLVPGGVELPGWLVYNTVGSWKEPCTNPEGFWSRALQTPEEIPKWFNPNDVKVGSIPPEVRDTFFHRYRDHKPEAEAKPSAIPVEVLEKNKAKKRRAS